ncbi:MAG: transcriptional regulator [Bacteroidales bacterium]|nr:transcriptional regulator [Bacteroidales bacterium]
MFKDLDPLLHSQLRLAIMSFLLVQGKSDFKELVNLTKATAGNLSVQIKKLEEANYIRSKKGFLNNYPHTSIEITKTGIDAFEKYSKAIKQYLNPESE